MNKDHKSFLWTAMALISMHGCTGCSHPSMARIFWQSRSYIVSLCWKFTSSFETIPRKAMAEIENTCLQQTLLTCDLTSDYQMRQNVIFSHSSHSPQSTFSDANMNCLTDLWTVKSGSSLQSIFLYGYVAKLSLSGKSQKEKWVKKMHLLLSSSNCHELLLQYIPFLALYNNYK